jgi:hypothetical protein
MQLLMHGVLVNIAFIRGFYIMCCALWKDAIVTRISEHAQLSNLLEHFGKRVVVLFQSSNVPACSKLHCKWEKKNKLALRIFIFCTLD